MIAYEVCAHAANPSAARDLGVMSSRNHEVIVGIYCPGREPGHATAKAGPDTRSLRSLLRD